MSFASGSMLFKQGGINIPIPITVGRIETKVLGPSSRPLSNIKQKTSSNTKNKALPKLMGINWD